MRPGAHRRKHQNGRRCGADGDTAGSIPNSFGQVYSSCVPLAHGRQVCAPGRTGEASKRATLRRGWGHSGLDPELLRSRFIVAVSPWRMADRYAPRGAQEEASKRATLRRGWGHSGLDPELVRPKFIVAVSSWRMADRSSRVSPMRPGRTGGSIKTGDVAARMGTQRARSRTRSAKIYRSCVLLAHGRQVFESVSDAPRAHRWKHQNPRLCGADGDTAGSIPNSFGQIYRSCVPLAPGRQVCAPGRTGEASKRATLRRGWGHSGLDPELVRSRLIVAVSPWRMADRYAPRGVQEKHQNGRRCGADGDTAGSIPNSFGQDLS